MRLDDLANEDTLLSMRNLIEHLREEAPKPAGTQIRPHSFEYDTQCPGNLHMYAQPGSTIDPAASWRGTADIYVWEAQKWVNAAYDGVPPGYLKCPEFGYTGWSTVLSLTQGLQHELGISPTVQSYGPGTFAAVKKRATLPGSEINGSGASVALRGGDAATVVLHIARRWHYEIAPLDTGEGGGITAHTARRAIGADFESNYLSATAIALHPTAYPLGGGEGLWPHHEIIVRDILADCEGTVTWGADPTPVKASHFHINAKPGSSTLADVAARLDTGPHAVFRAGTAGAVEDPVAPARRVKARRVQRGRAG